MFLELLCRVHQKIVFFSKGVSLLKAEQHIGQNVYAPSAFSITCESSNADAKPNKPGFGMKYDDNKDGRLSFDEFRRMMKK